MSRSKQVTEQVDEVEYEGEEYLATMDEIAMAAMTGMLASGQYAEPDAAAAAAWLVVVPAFLRGRQQFITMIAPMMMGGTG